MFTVALVGCSSNSSSEPTPSATASITKEQFCNAAKDAQQKLQAFEADLASGNGTRMNEAIQNLTTYYNLLLAALPANTSAAISQALEDAKSSASKGATDPNNQKNIDKLVAAIKKQCPNL